MPRPRKLGEIGVTVSAHVPLSLRQKLDQIAAQRGVSVSDVVREALEEYVKRLGDPLIESEHQPQLDPLTAVELEDFKEALNSFEKKVQELELAVKPLIEGRTIGPIGRRTLTSAEMQLISRIKNLRSEWLKYKRWYKSIGHRDPELAGRLAGLYSTIKALEKGFVKP